MNLLNKKRKQKQERILKNVKNGRAVKTVSVDEEMAFKIISTTRHNSMINYPHLMNDAKFLLEAATISPRPTMCEDYFFININPNLKNSKTFRLEFFRAVLKNPNVQSKESINRFVKKFNFVEEYNIVFEQKFSI